MRKILRYDYFHLLPFWTFFAPEPGVSDHELMYRDRTAEKIKGSWKKIIYAKRNKYIFWFTDNNKFKSKIISDHQAHLIEMINSGRVAAHQLKLAFSYLSLLSYVMKFPKDVNTFQRQFIIVEKNKTDNKVNVQITLASEWHQL